MGIRKWIFLGFLRDKNMIIIFGEHEVREKHNIVERSGMRKKE